MTETTIELMSNGAVDRLGVEQDTGQEAADEGADDAKHDVPDDAEPLVTLDEEAGEVPGDGAEDDPRDDAHGVYLRPNAGLSPACWGLLSARRPGLAMHCRASDRAGGLRRAGGS